MKEANTMANALALAGLMELIQWDKEYREVYSTISDTKSPKRAEWNAQVEKEIADVDEEFTNDVSKRLDSLVQTTQESESAAEVMHLLNLLDATRKTIKEYLDSLYYAENAGKGEGVKSTDEVIELAKLIESTFTGLLSFIPGGLITLKEIEESEFPTEWKDGRKDKDGNSKKVFSWDCPGKLRKNDNAVKGKGSKGAQVRSNSITRQLVVNGVAVEGRTLADQLLNAKIGVEWKDLQIAINKALGDGTTNDVTKYNDAMLVLDNDDNGESHTIGLRLKP